MRLAAYAGASTALAAGVVIYAFNQRANFYSACVYLAQSNLCLMILTNLILFFIASFMFGLQRMFYGPLRPIEIEQLYEKAWFAVTETCLAMTIFREEVGAWFLVMFVALLAGKVWGWIGEGRVEVLEQQPPANPRLFHLRLAFSLSLSLIYDMWIMAYTINTVIQQARPNMMVMFLFEFAVLTTSSYSTALRYVISLAEASVVKKQTQERLAERRREVREERVEILRRREASTSGAEDADSTEAMPALPSEDDIDEMDIEVPGWEAKGQWVLTLDLATDFVKLGIYSAFFFILLTFYGLPIHIMRDLFLTARSFVKRLTAFVKYRNATRDMNKRYPDATVEEIQREDTCIICREEMRPWSVTNPAELPAAQVNGVAQPPPPRAPTTTSAVNERSRPKKLPCGHVLHLGCLRSWLERQQVCPTCRRSVVDNPRTPPGQAQRPVAGAPGQVPGQPQLPGAGGPGQGLAPQPNGGVGGMINIGPLRLNFGRGQIPNLPQGFGGVQPAQQNAAPANARVYGLELGFPRLQPPAQGPAAPVAGAGTAIQAQLQQIEQQIIQDILSLQVSQAELQIVQNLQAELVRLRQLQSNMTAQQAGSAPAPQMAQTQQMPLLTAPPSLQRHGAQSGTSAISSGSSELPDGITIPEGWSLLPLQNLDSLAIPGLNTASSSIVSNNATVPQGTVNSTTGVTSPLPLSRHISNRPVTPLAPASAHERLAPEASSSSMVAHAPSSPHSGTASSAIKEDPQEANGFSALPNWGSSRLFSGPSISNGSNSNPSTQSAAPISSPNSPAPTNTSATEPPETSMQVPAAGDETQQGKGKAKAATVEDTNEDA